jgi:hypothetical protein
MTADAKKKWTQRSVKEKFDLKPTDYITVCSSCLQASCWLGEFYCDHYKTASTVKRTVRDLIKLDLEHPEYWAKEAGKL